MSIDPRRKINDISKKYNIKILDPKNYIKKGLKAYINENNFETFLYGGSKSFQFRDIRIHSRLFIF